MLAAAWTWPLVSRFGSRIPHDPGDPVLNAWILWWNAQALPFTERWWNAPVFYPLPGALALSENLAGIALFTTPLQLAGATPLAAYNAALLLSIVLSGFFTYLLVDHLLARAGTARGTAAAAAMCAGIAFAFAPYRAGQLAHLQVLTTQWMPLALLAMHAFLEGGHRRWLVVLGFAWILQALSNGYYLLFFPVLAGVWFLWFADWRASRRRGFELAGAWMLSSLCLLPALLEYKEVHGHLGLGRTLEEMRMFSAELASFVQQPFMLAFWPNQNPDNQERFLFPGLTAVALVIAALVLRRGRARWRSPFVFYGGATLLMWWLAMGPAAAGDPLQSLLRPYTWLAILPGFSGLRVPARFAMLGYLCLAVAAGLAFARLAPARPAWRRLLTAAVLAGLFVDGWITALPLVPPPGRVLLPEVRDALVLELPANDDQVNASAMYRSIAHGYPLVNGYSGHVPAHYRILVEALLRGDTSALAELARRRPLLVTVHLDRQFADHYQSLVEAMPGAQRLVTTNAGLVYLVPAQPARADAPSGDLLPAVLTEPAPAITQLDLGAPQIVRTVALPLRWHYDELSPQLDILGSADGVTWTTLWSGWTGGLALAGALEHPSDVPMRFTLPDPRVRYLRITPAPPWMRRELTVHAPR